jgi:hypothetical protein
MSPPKSRIQFVVKIRLLCYEHSLLPDHVRAHYKLNTYNPLMARHYFPCYVNVYVFYLLKPTGIFVYRLVYNSELLHADYNAFTRCIWISEQTETCALYSINRLVFIIDMESVYCALCTESLNKTDKFHSEIMNGKD